MKTAAAVMLSLALVGCPKPDAAPPVPAPVPADPEDPQPEPPEPPEPPVEPLYGVPDTDR